MVYRLLESGKFIESLEKDLAEAVARQDSVGYAIACDELGRTPEFPQLSEQGHFEMKLECDIISPFPGISLKTEDLDPELEKYKNFYRKGKFLNVRDFQKDAAFKGELLEKYFPGRFGNHGEQPIRFKTNAQKGFLFRILMEYAEKRTNQ